MQRIRKDREREWNRKESIKLPKQQQQVLLLPYNLPISFNLNFDRRHHHDIHTVQTTATTGNTTLSSEWIQSNMIIITLTSTSTVL